jgi:hypothetical protein
MHVMCTTVVLPLQCSTVLVCACVYAKWFAVCCLPDSTIGGQDKDVKTLTDKKAKKNKQRSHQAKAEKRKLSFSAAAEAEVEGEDEVLEWRCM